MTVWIVRCVAVLLSTLVLLGTKEVCAESHLSPCHDDQLTSAECLTAMRTLMADEDRFWFGTNYSRTCAPPASYSNPDCFNSDLQHLSIVTRLRGSNDSSVEDIQQVLNVTFDVPAGMYESCGNTYNVPPVTLTVDPTQTTAIPLWSANQRPMVTWAGADSGDTLYSLIVWDAGARILDGLIFNINGSDSHRGQTAFNYQGPKNPVPRDQPYVFLLYEQGGGHLNDDFVMGVLVQALSAGLYLSPQGIVNALSLIGPKGASILTVQTDLFATGFMKQNRIVNNCPAVLTPKFSALPLSYDVTGVQLMSSVDVRFTSPVISVSSCCKAVEIPSNVREPNPMGDGHIEPVYTRFAPDVSLVPNSFFDTYYFLRVQLTLLLVDVTDELRGTPDGSFNTILHWQVINIREGDVKSGETTLPYMAPLPLTKRGGNQRVFLFLLLRQAAMLSSELDLVRFTGGPSCPSHTANRCRFNLTAFITELQMTIEGASWFMTSPDAYSRQQAIAQGLQEKPAACRDVIGYQDPCPTTTCGAEVTHASLALFGLISALQMLGALLKALN